MSCNRRLSLSVKLALITGLMAGLGSPLSAQEPPALDRFLSPEVREAFAAAARHDELWQAATRDGELYLRERGIEVPKDLNVSFLNVQRQGDWMIWSDGDFGPLLEMYCPPMRTWWQECRKTMQVCETRQVAYCKATTNPDPKDPCYPKASVLEEVNVNCYTVCEQSIWEPELTLPIRPPFPPVLSYPGKP
jgi:hypothetical protein